MCFWNIKQQWMMTSCTYHQFALAQKKILILGLSIFGPKIKSPYLPHGLHVHIDWPRDRSIWFSGFQPSPPATQHEPGGSHHVRTWSLVSLVFCFLREKSSSDLVLHRAIGETSVFYGPSRFWGTMFIRYSGQRGCRQDDARRRPLLVSALSFCFVISTASV